MNRLFFFCPLICICNIVVAQSPNTLPKNREDSFTVARNYIAVKLLYEAIEKYSLKHNDINKNRFDTIRENTPKYSLTKPISLDIVHSLLTRYNFKLTADFFFKRVNEITYRQGIVKAAIPDTLMILVKNAVSEINKKYLSVADSALFVKDLILRKELGNYFKDTSFSDVKTNATDNKGKGNPLGTIPSQSNNFPAIIIAFVIGAILGMLGMYFYFNRHKVVDLKKIIVLLKGSLLKRKSKIIADEFYVGFNVDSGEDEWLFKDKEKSLEYKPENPIRFILEENDKNKAYFEIVDHPDTIKKAGEYFSDRSRFPSRMFEIDVFPTNDLIKIVTIKQGTATLGSKKEWYIGTKAKLSLSGGSEKGNKSSNDKNSISTYYLPLADEDCWQQSQLEKIEKPDSCFKLSIDSLGRDTAVIEFVNSNMITRVIENRPLKVCEVTGDTANFPGHNTNYTVGSGKAKLIDENWHVVEPIIVNITSRQGVVYKSGKNETIRQNFYLGFPDGDFFDTYGLKYEHQPGVTLFKFTLLNNLEAEFMMISDKFVIQFVKSAYIDKFKSACHLASIPTSDTFGIETDSSGRVEKDGERWRITTKAKIRFIG